MYPPSGEVRSLITKEKRLGSLLGMEAVGLWNNGPGFLLHWFNLDFGRELNFFSKDRVPRWVQFVVDMEASSVIRAIVLAPPPTRVLRIGVWRKKLVASAEQ